MKVQWKEIFWAGVMLSGAGTLVAYTPEPKGLLAAGAVATLHGLRNKVPKTFYFLFLFVNALLIFAIFTPQFIAVLLLAVAATAPLVFLAEPQESRQNQHAFARLLMSSFLSVILVSAQYLSQIPSAIVQKLLWLFTFLHGLTWVFSKDTEETPQNRMLKVLFTLTLAFFSISIFGLNLTQDDTIYFSIGALILFLLGNRESLLSLIVLSMMPSVAFAPSFFGAAVAAAYFGGWSLRLLILTLLFLMSFAAPPHLDNSSQMISMILPCIILGALWCWNFPKIKEWRAMDLLWTLCLLIYPFYILFPQLEEHMSSLEASAALPFGIFFVSALIWKFWRVNFARRLLYLSNLVSNLEKYLGSGVSPLPRVEGTFVPEQNGIATVEIYQILVWLVLFVLTLWSAIIKL